MIIPTTFFSHSFLFNPIEPVPSLSDHLPRSASSSSSYASAMSRVVGFSLVRASDSDDSNNNSNASSNVPVSFDNVLTDLNGEWNPRRSVFVCSQPGLYFFSFHGRGIGEDIGEEEKGWL